MPTGSIKLASSRDQFAIVQDDQHVAWLYPVARLNFHLQHRCDDLAGNVGFAPRLDRANRRDRFFNRAALHQRQISTRRARTVRPEHTRADPRAKRAPQPDEEEPQSGQRQEG